MQRESDSNDLDRSLRRQNDTPRQGHKHDNRTRLAVGCLAQIFCRHHHCSPLHDWAVPLPVDIITMNLKNNKTNEILLDVWPRRRSSSNNKVDCNAPLILIQRLLLSRPKRRRRVSRKIPWRTMEVCHAWCVPYPTIIFQWVVLETSIRMWWNAVPSFSFGGSWRHREITMGGERNHATVKCVQIHSTRQHTRIHRAEKPYKCEVYSTKFNLLYTLQGTL